MKNIKNIEIELFSYCNRKCLWCPNSSINRTINKEMDLDIFKKIIQELKNLNYKGNIILSRYNEPFSYIDILIQRINYIRSYLNNPIIIYTNGDFLNQDILNKINIDQLFIMDYDNMGLEKIANKLLTNQIDIIEYNTDYIIAKYNNINIYYYINWKNHSHIYNCAGFLPQYNSYHRISPCAEPQSFIGINYDGTVSPCHYIRNDIIEHQKYILGDLHQDSLHNIIKSTKAQTFKNKCKYGIFNPKSVCYYCLNECKE